MLLPAIGAAAAVLGLSVVIVLALHVTEPQELAPLPASDEGMRRYAEAGYFPLIAAARAVERHALATAAGLQTFLGLTIIFFSTAHAAWRGFASSRTRRWSNGFWMAGVIALCLAASAFHGLTPYMLDYWITSSAAQTGGSLGGPVSDIYGANGLNSRMSPAAFLTERGLYGAGFAAFLALLGHDLAYRLREALEDFGLIEEAADRHRRSQSRSAGQGTKGQFRRRAERREGAGTERGFGERDAPQAWSAPLSEEARARAVLGVGANASRREIERAYRSQMKRAHPDHGGSVERAAALNAARDVLLGR
ncbi:J domain-containing protein [Methylocystis sp. JAN1]|uniref:J domain-containing protein n=1 Tax=Methylocystis sp. JAN1 TaxID=3397211 RepID=UPI003FA25550